MQYDAVTGMYWTANRVYDPSTGRWYSQDPLGLTPDSNPYRYVGNGPTNATDPTGGWGDLPEAKRGKKCPLLDYSELVDLLHFLNHLPEPELDKLALNRIVPTKEYGEKASIRFLLSQQIERVDNKTDTSVEGYVAASYFRGILKKYQQETNTLDRSDVEDIRDLLWGMDPIQRAPLSPPPAFTWEDVPLVMHHSTLVNPYRTGVQVQQNGLIQRLVRSNQNT